MTKLFVHILSAVAAVVAMAALSSAHGAEDRYTTLRRQMADEIAAMAQSVGAGGGAARIDERVLAVLAKVPRHEFVPPEQTPHAYENRPLPIGHGQTISQPYIVAVMTELMAIKPGDAVLEIGTGSGYQAAVLAEMGARVSTIEIVEPLAKQATERLLRLGYRAVSTRFGDGYYGWPEHGPYDSVMVTAAAGHVPPPLIAQLKPGGRMVIPVGAPFLAQHLVLVEKSRDGSVTTRQLLPVRFVPLTGSGR